MKDEDGIILPERGKARKGCFMGIDVVHRGGSLMCRDRATPEKTCE